MEKKIAKCLTVVGAVAFLTGLIGEVIYYGIVFEMLMWFGLVAMSAVGLYNVWGE